MCACCFLRVGDCCAAVVELGELIPLPAASGCKGAPQAANRASWAEKPRLCFCVLNMVATARRAASDEGTQAALRLLERSAGCRELKGWQEGCPCTAHNPQGNRRRSF